MTDRAALEARLNALRAARDASAGTSAPPTEPTRPEPSQAEESPSDDPRLARLETLHREMVTRIEAERDGYLVETALARAFRDPSLLRRIQPDQADAMRAHLERLGLVRVVDGEAVFHDLDGDPQPLVAGLIRWLRSDPIASEHYGAATGTGGSGDKPPRHDPAAMRRWLAELEAKRRRRRLTSEDP